MSVQLVDVFYHGRGDKLKVGRLAFSERKIYFEYDLDFIKSGIELSPYILPLKEGASICEDMVFDGIYGIFADSLPDGWGKLLIDRYLISQGINYHGISMLDRLLMVGEYGVGALSYEPAKEAILLNSEIDFDELANTSLDILNGVSENNIKKLIEINGSSGGARPKVMVQLNKENHAIDAKQTLKSGYEHYMVKFPGSIDHKDIGKVEYAYSLMAKDAGILMEDTRLIKGKDNSYFQLRDLIGL